MSVPETVSEAEFNGDVLINLMEEIQHSGYEWSVNSTVIASLLFVFKHTGQKKTNKQKKQEDWEKYIVWPKIYVVWHLKLADNRPKLLKKLGGRFKSLGFCTRKIGKRP